MLRRAGVRRPRAVIAAWAVAIGALALIGAGVEQRLHRSDLLVPGTGSAAAGRLAEDHFGPNSSLVVLLEGPRREIDTQGRRLAAKLEARDRIAVVGPWVPGASPKLRPAPDKGLVLVRADRPFEEVSEEVVPDLRREVARTIRRPLVSHVTGYADVAAGVHNGSVEALERAELIAAPLLLLVLLLVFRSPIAAALPLGLGLATIGASRGMLDLANRLTDLDVVALNLASMMGLALGVDYSLVIVSRFREELAAGRGPIDAVETAMATAGRTVVFAGLALIAAMAAAVRVAPGDILASSGVGTIAAAVLSVVAAVSVLPAMLVLLGPRVDRWSFGSVRAGESRWGGLALGATRRPVLAAALVLGLIVALSAPALAMDMGTPDPRNLPASSPERQGFERVFHGLGGGWAAPYEVIVAAERGPVTERRRLAALDRWQASMARDRDVVAVLGPGAISRGARRLGELERGLRSAEPALARARRDGARLDRGLERMDRGIAELRGGLTLAATGVGRLKGGAGRGAEGSARLRDGLIAAQRGASRFRSGLREGRAGASALAAGSRRLVDGGRRLQRGLARARRGAGAALPRLTELRQGLEAGSRDIRRLREPAQRSEAELEKALAALDEMLPTSKLDPAYRRAYEAAATALAATSGRNPITGEPVEPGYEGLDAALDAAAGEAGRAAAGVTELERGMGSLLTGLAELERGAEGLNRGLVRLEGGVERLSEGVRRLQRGGGSLAYGLSSLGAGSRALAAGAGRLEAGAARLEEGLLQGSRRSGALEAGTRRIRSAVSVARTRTARLGNQLRAGGGVETHVFRSGYLPLAAVDAARPELRSGSTFAVNLDRGGSAARIVVIEEGDPTDAGNRLRARLERETARLSRESGMTAAVGGPAAQLQDFDAETSSRLWLLIAALVGVTYLALVPVLRSLLLPLLAVLLNVMTVAAAFGVLALGFVGDAPLGGSGELDAISILAIFAIVFGLSIDYEVFLLARMREGYALTGTTDGAIAHGLRRTAGVITGAALIMIGVFAAFAIADIASMRQLGIGLTVAVLLDATVVRLVLLPAIIRLAGEASWWLPAGLSRLLPDVDPKPSGHHARSAAQL